MTFSATQPTAILPKPLQKLEYAAPSRGGDKKVRFASIDGLRGIACLAVLWFHAWYGTGGGHWPSIPIKSHHIGPQILWARGYGGVQLFFVLSGFCLSFPIFSRPERAVNWGKYFVARIRRIVPPYWAALFLFGAISLAPQQSQFHAFFNNIGNWPGLGAFIVKGVFFWKAILAGPFWTLVLEWRWYFVFPLAIWLCRKSGAWLMLAVSIPLSALSMWLKFGVDMAWTINWTEGVFRYLPLFAFGMLASELAASGGRSAIELFLVRNCRWGLLLFLVILFAVPADENHSWQGTIQSTYTFGPLAFFATLAAVRDPFVDRILAWKPLVWVGSFSYSLYLLHGPFVLAMGAYFKTHVNSPLEQFLLIIVFTPLLMIPASYLFYLAFERPFLTRKFEKPGPLNVQVAAIPEAAAP